MEDQLPITKNEFYLVQQNVSERIKNVESHINEKYNDIMSSLVKIEGKQDKTNGRVRWAEKMIYTAMGAIIVLGWLYTNQFFHCIGRVCNIQTTAVASK